MAPIQLDNHLSGDPNVHRGEQLTSLRAREDLEDFDKYSAVRICEQSLALSLVLGIDSWGRSAVEIYDDGSSIHCRMA